MSGMVREDEKPEVLFVLSVDTEEEWDWSGPFPTSNFQLANIRQLTDFQAFCVSLGIRLTYFVDYAVADDPASVTILRGLAENAEQVEIGAHLHPWCNPPVRETIGEAASHVVNLPLALVEEKLVRLTEKLTDQFGISPVSFRTGRWGISGEILKTLANHGYKYDSSVYPFYSNEYFSCQGASPLPYWPDYGDALRTGHQREILEVPVSVGFNRTNYALCNRLQETLSRPPFNWLRTIGLAWYLGVFRKIYLCPELSSAEDMKALVDTALARNHRLLHMYLHSSSLLTGATGLLDSPDASREITQRIQAVIAHMHTRARVRFVTLQQAAEIIKTQGWTTTDRQDRRVT